MSVLAHPGPISFAIPRRRHLAAVPAIPDTSELLPEEEQLEEQLADVIALPVAPVRMPARPVRTAPGRALPARDRVEAAPRPRVRDAAAAPLRLTARGRAVIAGLGILGAAVVGSVVGIAASASQAEPAVEIVTVASGESLWSIASSVAAPGADVRDVMSEIADLNGLEGATLVAGQQLTVPSND